MSRIIEALQGLREDFSNTVDNLANIYGLKYLRTVAKLQGIDFDQMSLREQIKFADDIVNATLQASEIDTTGHDLFL